MYCLGKREFEPYTLAVCNGCKCEADFVNENLLCAKCFEHQVKRGKRYGTTNA